MPKKGKEHWYLYNDAALEQLAQQIGRQDFTLQRCKGLGEMNPEQLWQTTMNPAERTLMRVALEDAMAADDMFSVLMGDKVEPRRKFIEDNAHLVRNLDI